MLPKANWGDYNCVIRAWRLARWANHAWGLLSGDQIAEVWNICPSLKAFCDLLAGYAVARGWIAEGPAGYGVWAPSYDDLTGGLVVDIGTYGQIHAAIRIGETVIVYRHGERYATATMAQGRVVVASGYPAEPRDWARIARLLLVAEEPTDLEEERAREFLRDMVRGGPAALREFDRYFSLTGPQILAGPEVIMG